MTDAQLWSAWGLWVAVAAVVVVVAAALLVAILVTARGILEEAGRALDAAERVRRDTLPIWDLDTTNRVADQLVATVEAIEQDGGAIAEALQSHAGTGGMR